MKLDKILLHKKKFFSNTAQFLKLNTPAPITTITTITSITTKTVNKNKVIRADLMDFDYDLDFDFEDFF